MKHIITSHKAIFIFIIFILFVSCERFEDVTIEGFDCYYCYQEKPEWVDLTVFATLNDENPEVPLEIYIGDFEEGNFDWHDTARNEEWYVPVKPGNYYSVLAKYKDGSRTIIAVDGDKIKVKYNDTDCDEGCYYQSGGHIDVRLR